MWKCGIDVHKNYSRIHTLDSQGAVVESTKLKTRKSAFQQTFQGRDPMRIVLESGTDAAWIAKTLRELGHEVIVAHARRIKLIAESAQKTDKRDAEWLAQLADSGLDLLCETHVRGEEAERIRTLLKARKQLVECRTKLSNALRGFVRKTGHRLPSGSPRTLPEKLSNAAVPRPLKAALGPMAFSIYVLSGWIAKMDAQLEEAAEEHAELVEKFRAICGVGLQTALAFVATIEKPARFERSKQVGAYLGLCPAVSNSGNEDGGANKTGGITKRGDGLLRHLLVQAAQTMLREGSRDSELRRFGKRIEAKKGKQKAAVAVARKLSVVMHTLWVRRREYDPFYYKKHHEDD